MALIDKFLESYKEYESVLREQNIDTKEFEEQSDDVTANRLRICRMMRNYLSHNSDAGFLVVSERQVKFLEKLTMDLRMGQDVVKKHLKSVKTGTCTLKDKCTDVLARMNKLKVTEFPVYDVESKIFGTVSIYDIGNLVLESRTKKVSDIKKFGRDYAIVTPDMKIEDVPKDVTVYCTSDGTVDGKLLGVMLCQMM